MEVKGVFADLGAAARRAARTRRHQRRGGAFAFLADLRYVGQEHTISIPVRHPGLLSGDLRAAADAVRRRARQALRTGGTDRADRSGQYPPGGDGNADRHAGGAVAVGAGVAPEPAVAGRRRDVIFTDAGEVGARPASCGGPRSRRARGFEGPAVIEEPNATTLIPTPATSLRSRRQGTC